MAWARSLHICRHTRRSNDRPLNQFTNSRLVDPSSVRFLQHDKIVEKIELPVTEDSMISWRHPYVNIAVHVLFYTLNNCGKNIFTSWVRDVRILWRNGQARDHVFYKAWRVYKLNTHH